MKAYSDMGYKWPLLTSIFASTLMLLGSKSPWYIDILFFIVSVGLACVYVDTVRYTRGYNYKGSIEHYDELITLSIAMLWIFIWIGLTSTLYIFYDLLFQKTDIGIAVALFYSLINSFFISVSLCFGFSHGE